MNKRSLHVTSRKLKPTKLLQHCCPALLQRHRSRLDFESILQWIISSEPQKPFP